MYLLHFKFKWINEEQFKKHKDGLDLQQRLQSKI